ncbi:MAG: hypothetical protein RSB91_05430 [Clostridia bacterium]
MGLITIPISEAVDIIYGTKTVTLGYPLIRGDDEAHEIILTLTSGGNAIDLAGATVNCYALLPDKTSTAIASGTVSGNVARATFSEAFYAKNGCIDIIMRLKLGNVIIAPLRIITTVQSGITDTIIDPTHVIRSLDELLAQIDACNAATDNANNAAAATTSVKDAVLAAESIRQSNEGERASAESTRTQAERQRQQDASQAVSNANAAAQGANTMAARAGTAAQSIEGLTIAATKVAAGGQPTATVAMVDGHMHVTVGMVTGDKGEQGKQFVILGGAYATPEALQAGVKAPGVGDQYNVGAAAPYSIYRWTGKAWENQGRLQGAPGINGTNGTNGKDGAPGINGTNGKDGAPGINGTNGKDGAPGKDGTNASAQVFVAELLAGGWSVSAPYTQSVNVAGVTPAMLPFADVVTAQSAATAQAELEAWGLIGKITTGSGTITATCYEEKPAVTLTVRMQAIA